MPSFILSQDDHQETLCHLSSKLSLVASSNFNCQVSIWTNTIIGMSQCFENILEVLYETF